MNLQMRARLKAVRLDRNAFQIAAIYLLIGGLWILLSDRFAEAISKNIQTLTTISTYKGWGYVLVTGLILYWLIHLNNSRLQKENEELQAAKKNYQDIFDNATVGIYRSTPDGRLLAANPKLASMFGYDSPEEILASISDIGGQVYKDSTRRDGYRKTITEQGFINDFVNEERRKDGTWIWTSTTAHAVKDEAGDILYYEGFSTEVTHSKQIEEKLQASEHMFKLFVEFAPAAIAMFDRDMKYLAASRRYFEDYRLPNENIIGRSHYEVFPEIPEHWKEIHRRCLAGATEKAEQDPFPRADGKLDWVRWEILPWYEPSGVVGGIILFSEVITEHKQSAEKLLASEIRYRRLFENAKDGILILDGNSGEILDVNPFLEELLGYSRAEFLGKQLWEIGLFKDIVANKAAFLKLQEEGYVRYENLPLQTKDGPSAWVEFVSNVYDVGNTRVVQCNIRNITERKRAEELLSESEERFRTLTEQSVDGIVLIDEEGHVIEWNPAEEKITGIPRAEAIGALVWDIQYQILVPEHRAKLSPEHLKKLFLDSFQSGDGEQLGKPLDIEILPVNGEHKFIQQTSFRIKTEKGNRVGSIFRDITKRKLAEKALGESEKHFHSLFDNMLEGYAYCEMIYENGQPSDLIYLEVNLAFEKLTGITKAIGRKISDVIPGIRESNPELLEIYGKTALTGKSTRFETYVDELKIWFSISVYSVEKNRFVAVFDNISERKRIEKSIAESNRQLAALVTSLDDIVFEVDAQGTYLNVWTANENLLAQPKAEMIARQIKDTLQEETANSILEAIGRVLKANQVEEMEYSLDLRDGLYWFLARLSPIDSPDGTNKTVSILVRDITERKAAQEVIRLRLVELELVHQSGLELSRVLEPEEIARRIIDEMETHLNWHHTIVRLYDPESQTLKIIGYNVQGALSQTERQELEGRFNLLIQNLGDGLTGWAVLHDQTLRIGDLRRDPRYTEAFPGLNSGLYVPIKTDDRILGVISVENELPDAFSESDEQLLSTLANQAAIALENSRLHKETQQQVKQLQALHSIDLAITNSLDLKITLDLLVHEVIEQSGADAAAIYLLRPDINNLEYLLSQGFHTYLLEKLRHSLSLNESLAGRAIRQQHVIESQASQESKSDLREIWEAEGFHSIYTFPLMTKGEPKGVMKVFYRSEVKVRTSAWMSFLETLAGQAAIAIENIRLFEGLQRSNMELAIAYDATIEGWSRAMDMRDEETEGHTQRVVDTALKLAADFGFSGEMLMNIRRGALLHDIGKLGVPDNILLKPDKLTDDEWEIMKKHPTFAFEMLAPIEYLNHSINIPYCHHEKWDGTGYPRGMRGEQIPLEARIFAVVDVWDALTSDRPYRKAWTKEKVTEYIRSLAGTHFDPAVVERFLELQKKEN